MLGKTAFAALSIWLLASSAPSAAQHAPITSQTMDFSIARQSLGSALLELARLTDTEIFIPNDPISPWASSDVRGQMTPEEALNRMLRCTPFSGHITADRIIALRGRRPG